MQPPLECSPPFVPERAFVIQFGRETAVDAGRLVGRVEHVVSRQAVRFESLDALVAFMTAVLREGEWVTQQTLMANGQESTGCPSAGPPRCIPTASVPKWILQAIRVRGSLSTTVKKAF
jgi:hypothetical protein